jgi:GT2 family glycosyltransferase
MPKSMARRPRSGDHRALIHWLNQRYKQAWDRAERLQAALDDIHRSRAWKLLCWLRRLRSCLRGQTPLLPAADFAARPIEDLPAAATGRVSILIPFRDRPGLLRALLTSLRGSSYRRFDIVLLDNGSTWPRTRRLLARLSGRRGIQVLSCPGPFHFARLCNRGAAHATGDFLLFLNNDMEVLSHDWLKQLLCVAAHPRVGIVGGTLLYPDGTLQHAGIFPCGTGQWVHAYRGYPGDYPGDRGELLHVRQVPAVTAACLLIRRDLFASLGGFSEEFPVTGNDVDLCVRARQRGLVVAVTPHARLLHFESLSRGYAVDATPDATVNE